ncbi:tail fiber protein [Pectobacterium versatile]|uniref:phage tail fiber protein n=1 Tax=Pectobacterium versatile TaxID=2488639 RepID=UPI000CDE9C70|nr:hypothetical protein [Pectobacterium versatile]POY58577.1 tail fiber protein [Pectobacterium versatile]POY62440.1 tail fiber protein [Pectobacterium versatile]
MSWYKTGSVTATSGSKIITGAGTQFTNPLNSVSAGRMLLLPGSGTVQIYEIESVQSDTQLTLVSAFTGTAGSGKSYAIPTSPTVSIEQFAHEFASTLAYYQQQLQGWQSILTGSGNIILTTPDGQSVTVRSQTEWDRLLDTKVSLDTAQTLTGKKTFRQNWETITIVNESLGQPGYFAGRDFDGTLRWIFGYETPDANYLSFRNSKANTVMLMHSNRNIYVECVDFIINNNRVWTSGNTTVDANGFLKVASPIVKLFADGSSELNEESDGVVTTRLSEGVYHIDGCLGLNADRAWGGDDGGIDVPVCRNKLPRLWVDYGGNDGSSQINPDGSIVIRTYHRTHPNAMPFARNERDGYVEGDPIDIPADTFLSIRVQMPAREEMPNEPIINLPDHAKNDNLPAMISSASSKVGTGSM